MAFKIDIQRATPTHTILDDDIRLWVELVLKYLNQKDVELTIRIVNSHEMTVLNEQYRKKTGPTNVLSFPSELPKAILGQMDYTLLGDIIICPEVLDKEATEQQKTISAHWAHIVMHGVLHLLGYDHIQEDDEKIMQTLEIELLQKINFANPYEHYE